jgi:hypothetical protein
MSVTATLINFAKGSNFIGKYGAGALACSSPETAEGGCFTLISCEYWDVTAKFPFEESFAGGSTGRRIGLTRVARQVLTRGLNPYIFD